MSWVPLIALVVSSISAIIGALTYRRVTKKTYSKVREFSTTVASHGNKTILSIDGTGLFERLEIKADGTRDAKLVLSIDNEVFLHETFKYLLEFAPQYPRFFSTIDEPLAITIDLAKNFRRNYKFSIENNTDTPITVSGKLHFKTS